VDFFRDYLTYTAGGECPTFYHRWSALAGLGAFLGRDYWFQHGRFNVNPNMYVMLIGASGSRKSTAIKTVAEVLKAAGYTTIAAEKTSKEKFILDLAGEDLFAHGSTTGTRKNGKDIIAEMLEENIFEGGEGDSSYAQIAILADEFNLFIGTNNIEFLSLLGVLWDYNGTYKNRIKTGKSIEIYNPTISILGGNTQTNFAHAFPPEILGQGFFSRLLLVHGERTSVDITFPPSPSAAETSAIAEQLLVIKSIAIGQAALTSSAKSLLEKIYKSRVGVDDFRFESYNSRRLTHLLKLCLIVSASFGSATIDERTVVYANTILVHTESLMPKALGEFGKAKHSDVSNKLMQIIEAHAPAGIMLKDIWPHVSSDLDSLAELAKLLHNLLAADKIMNVQTHGFLPKKKLLLEHDGSTVDFSFLTPEERDIR
jgi:energy-coupling factor transporter ATP-binding protein EcfA2